MSDDFTHSLVDIGRELKRSVVYLRGLQTRFDLPEFEGAGYSDAYLEFLTKLVHLRALSIPEETLRNLWHTEKKLLLLSRYKGTSRADTIVGGLRRFV